MINLKYLILISNTIIWYKKEKIIENIKDDWKCFIINDIKINHNRVNNINNNYYHIENFNINSVKYEDINNTKVICV